MTDGDRDCAERLLRIEAELEAIRHLSPPDSRIAYSRVKEYLGHESRRTSNKRQVHTTAETLWYGPAVRALYAMLRAPTNAAPDRIAQCVTRALEEVAVLRRHHLRLPA